MLIIGAGLSGLLCGVLNPGARIYEAGPDRPSDHKAVLRMKTDEISRLTGIPFKKVTVHKAIWLDGKEVQPSPRVAHMYSQKVTGKTSARSILDISPGVRFIPPENFVALLKSRCDICYNKLVTDFMPWIDEPIISTIPMPVLAKIIGEPIDGSLFTAQPIYVTTVEIPECDSNATIYYPGLNTDVYRATLTGCTLIVESMGVISESDIDSVLISMGLPYSYTMVTDNHIQKYGKIEEVDKKIRGHFISKATIDHGIYSLGRFACWRPETMVDDVIEDIFVIRRLIEEGRYAAINHKQGVVK